MKVSEFPFRPAAAIIAAGFFAAMGAQADTTVDNRPQVQSDQPVQRSGPSPNNDKYKQLKMQCERDVQCGKASADTCVEAAAILLGDDLPDEFREVKEDQRVKIALRLLERGVDSNNIAQGRAYDLYNRVGFLSINAYADPYRAAELMEMMTKSSYPGGYLRKARSSVSILSLTTNDAEKKEYCASAKKLLSEGKLDADSQKIAKDILSSTACTATVQ